MRMCLCGSLQRIIGKQKYSCHSPGRLMCCRAFNSKWSLPDDADPCRSAGFERGVTAEVVSRLCYEEHLAEAVEALGVLVQTDGFISKSLFNTVGKKCAGKKDLVLGRRVHALTVKKGYQGDTFLCNHFIRMYASHGRLQDAMDVFAVVAEPNVFMWSTIISAHVRQGQNKQAIELYQRMRRSGVKPDGFVFVAALQACGKGSDLKTGEQVHADVLASGVEPDLFVCSSLVDMYAKCGSLKDAQRVFDGLGQKDVVTWTALLAGYSQQGMGQEALHLYSAMQSEGIAVPNGVTFMCLLQACGSVGTPALEIGKQLHAQLRERGHEADVYVASSLVSMYAKCGSLADAQAVFDSLVHKDVVMWTAMIAGYSQQGMVQEALRLYSAMQEEGIAVPDCVTFVRLLQACASTGTPAFDKGKQLHLQIIERGFLSDMFVASSLVNMYAKCGSLVDAHKVFDRLGQKDVVTWTALIAGYSQQDMGQEALHLYSAMQEDGTALPNSVTFVSLLQACASVGAPALETGKQLHTQIREAGHQADVFIGNSLVNMYAKCSSLEDAQRLFDGLGQKDVASWNALIAGYSQKGMGQEALHLYGLMQEEGMAIPDSVTYLCLLQACASVGPSALKMGKQLDAQIREQGHHADVKVACSLVNMYAKCGSLEDAQTVFDRLGEKDVVTWTALIAGYSQQGMGQEALRLYSVMQDEGIAVPDSVTFVSLLQACASVGTPALKKGKQLHAQIEKRGHQDDAFIANSLVNMYAKCGSLEDAQRVFDILGKKDVVTWNSMITGYSQQGMGLKALGLYSAMQREGIGLPTPVTFVCLLQACASVGTAALENGKQLHVDIREQGYQADVSVANSLVNMYAKCGSLEDAQRVFDELGQKDVVTWNALITGYSQQGMGSKALRLYSAMQEEGMTEPDSVTYVCLLQACASVGVPALETGKELHEQIRDRGHLADVFVASSLVNMYAKCGSLADAQGLFDGLVRKDNVTWNAMIAGLSQQGMGQEALRQYGIMQEEGNAVPNSVTFVCLLQACASVGDTALEMGKQIHAQIREQGHEADAFVANSLVNMYAKCGSLEDAQSVFDGLSQKDVVTWNVMITGYSHQGMAQEAFCLYNAMQEEGMCIPNSVTFVCLLQACASMGSPALKKGQQLHIQLTKRGHQADMFVASSLVNMYAKCGSLEDARRVFDRLGRKDVVTWNAMIAGYTQQGMCQEAFCLYSAMQKDGTAVPNSVTFVCLLQACANVAALHLGRQLHLQVKQQGLQADVVVASSLINMYGKCGSMVAAQHVFDALPHRDVVTWSALIAGYASQGDSDVVFDLVQEMREDGIQPVGITFLSVLTVCSHAGLVSKGREYFASMSKQYGIKPTVEHYTCMVDLLGRAGQLDEALALVRTMPGPSNAAVWHTLLGACQKWGNVEVGLHAFEQAVKVDNKNAAAYVSMSNIYLGARMWEQAQEMQERRKRMRAWKQPGQSWWTDVDGVGHRFLVRDKNHPNGQDRLEQVLLKTQEDGYVAQMASSRADVPHGGQGDHYCRHAEMLGVC